MKRLLMKLIAVIASALVAWRLVRRVQELQAELARSQRELASQRARAMEAERQLATLTQQTAAPVFGRGVIASNGFVSVDALTAEAQAASAALDAEAEAQALDGLLIENELPLAEVEVLQAGVEASRTDETPVEIDMAALASRSGAVEPLVGVQTSPSEDLTLIDGIGPVYAARLREHGIRTFERLAGADEATLTEIIQAPAWRRPDFAAWIHEATRRTAGEPAARRSAPVP
jgi:predicted flap endonuclease-1-like 5' DNA nuclease